MKSASVGNRGEGVRSDCFVNLEITGSGGVVIDLESKVEALYGHEIRKQVEDMLEFFDIPDAHIEITDSGALPFVIAARIEAAIKKLIPSKKEFLFPVPEFNRYSTKRDRHRFSRLYLPGNTPHLMVNAGIHKPDGVILDLEDAVSVDKKFEASFLVRNALRSLNFYGAERMVRINQLPRGLDDLEFVVAHPVNLILIPKCEEAEQVGQVNDKIREIQQERGLEGNIWLMPIIESARGIVHVDTIAQAENVVALAIGLEDFTADLGTRRSESGIESFYSRSRLVIACKAAHIQAIDSVFSDVADMEALKRAVLESKSLGFNGMGCIHPRQIKVIHENFAPDTVEIEKAKKIFLAFEEAERKGLGVVSLGTKMIDPPVVKRAQQTIQLAMETGKLSKNWRDES